MGNINIYLEVAKETERLTLEGLEFKAALRQAKEKFFGKGKGYKDSDQTNPSNHCKTFRDIIPPGDDLDNREVFDIQS